MKNFALLFLGLLFTTLSFAQDELSLVHQTIMANAQEMDCYKPVFLDLSEAHQLQVDKIANMIVEKAEPSTIAKELAFAAKETGLEQTKILQWAIREATIITLGLQEDVEVRTWTIKALLDTESGGNLEKSHAIKDYFDSAKAVVSNIE